MIYVPTVRNPIMEQMTIPHSSHLLNPSRFFWSFSVLQGVKGVSCCAESRQIRQFGRKKQEEEKKKQEEAERKAREVGGCRRSFFAEPFRRSVLIPKCAITPVFFVQKSADSPSYSQCVSVSILLGSCFTQKCLAFRGAGGEGEGRKRC